MLVMSCGMNPILILLSFKEEGDMIQNLSSIWTSIRLCAQIWADLLLYSKDKYAAIIKDSPWILHSALVTSHETN